MEPEDQLSKCRELFYAGYYKQVVDRCDFDGTGGSEEDRLEQFCLKFRALAQLLGHGEVLGSSHKAQLNQADPNSPPIKAILLLIAYTEALKRNGSAEEKGKILGTLKTLETSRDVTARIIVASIFATRETASNFIDLTNRGTLELLAVATFIYLSLNRVDLAQKSLNDMMSIDDDAAITKAANGWVSLACGNHQEAYLTFNDVLTQCNEGEDQNSSALILNGLAVANLQRGLWPEAAEDLLKALQIAPEDPGVLANLVCCEENRGQTEDAEKYMQILRRVSPSHPLVQSELNVDKALRKFAN